MVPENIKEIARKFMSGTATEEETALLHQWYDTWKDDETIIQADTEDPDVIETRMLSRLLEQIRQKTASPAQVVTLSKRKWWKVAAAAAIIIASGAGLFFWQQQSGSNTGQGPLALADTTSGIKPGVDKALLTLDNGKQVVLDSSATGIVSKQGNTTITNLNSQLTYEGVDNLKEETTYYNTVITGKGNQYQLILPDGSRVWLNAASSLRFPTKFSEQERVIELTGEGYFEVAKDKSRTFKVLLPRNTGEEATTAIEVLGTHFNIMAYQDEANIKTSLLEGSVKVIKTNDHTRSALLQPGQQALIPFGNNPAKPDNVIRVVSADVEEAVAWKNGYFQFTDAPITTVMRQVSRWYNVEVVYDGNVQQEVFSGSIPRKASIAQLIKILELTKTVKISIEGRKLIAAPYPAS